MKVTPTRPRTVPNNPRPPFPAPGEYGPLVPGATRQARALEIGFEADEEERRQRIIIANLATTHDAAADVIGHAAVKAKDVPIIGIAGTGAQPPPMFAPA